jgi:16S rRNA (cytidine1402-2'-O)-methyltransferase
VTAIGSYADYWTNEPRLVIIATVMAALFIVATPIGNLEDITLRAIRTLKEVKLIAAEDTRKTRQLLKAYDIATPTTSYHEHNKITKLGYILQTLEQNDVALVSDAGMPGISDPGYELIAAAVKKNIKIVPVPGPSVLTTAMVLSGLPTDKFCFLGFLPHKSGERKKMLQSRADEKDTLILFEAPHRLIESLEDMLEIWGDRQVTVCREMTKVYEEVFRGTLSTAVGHFSTPRGEFTLVIAGRTESARPQLDAGVKKQLADMKESGIPSKEAIGLIAKETGLSHKELYQAWINIK